MVALRELQAEKVKEAERSFAILVELSQMEELPEDWEARKALNESVMNRVLGLPKAITDTTGVQTIRVEYVKRANGGTDGNAPSAGSDSSRSETV